MTILLPRFDYQEIKDAINPRQISLKLDCEQEEMKERIEEMRTKLSKELELPPVVVTRWERNRDRFIRNVLEMGDGVH